MAEKHDQQQQHEQPAGAGGGKSQPPPKAPAKMYHPIDGTKEAQTDAEITASLADGWTFDPETDPWVAAQQKAQQGAEKHGSKTESPPAAQSGDRPASKPSGR